jgi:hypothetical protein
VWIAIRFSAGGKGIKMDTITMPDLRELISSDDGHCISIYMPTHPKGIDGKQDGLRLKNLAAAAERQLIERGMRSVEARKFVAPLAAFPFREKWERRKNGIAIFRSKKNLVHYWLDEPLQETLVVAPRFYMRPLLSAIGVSSRFIILAISRNQVRVLKCTGDGYEKLSVPRLPTNIEQALNLQTADRGEQVHSGMRGDLGKEAGVFHGQGGHRDTIKDETQEYFRLVSQVLRPVLRQTPWPVILAGVEYEVAMYRQHSDCRDIAEESLHGCFDYVTDQQLYEQVLPVATRIYQAQYQQAFSRYRTSLNRIRTSEDVDEIIPASYEGRIDTLFFDNSAELFGRYDCEKKSVEIVQERDPMLDLIELAVTQTLLHSGAVYPATGDELPASGPMCAIIRYW